MTDSHTQTIHQMNSMQVRISRVVIFVFAFVGLGCSFRTCRADLILSFQDTVVQSGRTGFVDIYIRSSTGTDFVDFANYTFDITAPATAAPGTLRFQPTAEQLKTEQSIAFPVPYVFLGDTSPLKIGATVQELTPQSITGFDETNSGIARQIGMSNLLLARFELQHIGAAQVGDFVIKLRKDSNLTYFTSDFDNDIPTTIANESYSNFGAISVSIAAVPEPCSISLFSVALLGIWFRRCRVKFQSIR